MVAALSWLLTKQHTMVMGSRSQRKAGTRQTPPIWAALIRVEGTEHRFYCACSASHKGFQLLARALGTWCARTEAEVWPLAPSRAYPHDSAP